MAYPSRRRRRSPAAFAPAQDLPISALNTTPLIDVMLVLLIMFIVTIPMATHGIKMDLPPPGGRATADPEVHRLVMDRAGRLRIDGMAVSEAGLAPRLRAFGADEANWVLHVQTDGEARYEDFDRVLAVVKGAGVARVGFVGNEAFTAALAR